MKILFLRADASLEIGTGHVFRMLALAQAWQDAWHAAGEEATAVFLCASVPPALAARVRADGFDLRELPAGGDTSADGTATLRCAREMLDAAGVEPEGTWVVADGYHFGLSFQEQVRSGGFKLLVIDDNGENGTYACDAVLNQNVHAAHAMYAAMPPERCLLGPRFALLRREFRERTLPPRSVSDRIGHVLVSMGGGDPGNETGKVLAALHGMEREIEVTALAGAANPNLHALQAEAKRWNGRCRIVVNAADMPDVIRQADGAITAAGSTCWELLHLGTPLVTFVAAENQRRIAEELERLELGIRLDRNGAWSADDLAAILDGTLASCETRQAIARRAERLVDAQGAARVAALLGAPLRVALVTARESWINEHAKQLVLDLQAKGCRVEWVHEAGAAKPGDVAFYLSYDRIVGPDVLRRFAHNLVVHESQLPAGRGWSPMTWQILEGKRRIPVTLFEAEERVDAGPIYAQTFIDLQGSELVDEWRQLQYGATHGLCLAFVDAYPFSVMHAREQAGEGSMYPRRGPDDSRLDPDKTIREQFNLLRVVDNDKYPAFFELDGNRYTLSIRRKN